PSYPLSEDWGGSNPPATAAEARCSLGAAGRAAAQVRYGGPPPATRRRARTGVPNSYGARYELGAGVRARPPGPQGQGRGQVGARGPAHAVPVPSSCVRADLGPGPARTRGNRTNS